jgi:NAD(P)-dependent dehydrogenase (short-subunit alcohol dehydrogenase family)
MSTRQTPLGSGFGPATTAADVIKGCDLSGKVAIVTGGYSGIGLETARTLAAAGARVIVPARDLDKARKALEPYPALALDSLDLMNPTSVDDFADSFLAAEPALHILVNNAGIMANPLTRDLRGYESQFATNHLGHFQLTARLWPALRQAGNARVIAVSSRGHRFAGVDLEDPNFERRPYDPWVAYGQSKSANILFAVTLDALGAPHGVRAFSLHPGGIVATELSRHMTPEQVRATGYVDGEGRPIIDPAHGMKTVAQGAATTVWCATSPRLDGLGGVYCENCDIADAVPAGSDAPYGVRPWATDPDLAARLWRLSERLTGAAFI